MGSICITSNTGQHFRNIARSMELSNKIADYMKKDNINYKTLENVISTFVILLAPLAPHFAEELWEKLGKSDFAYNQKWPEVNEEELKGGTKEIPIQVNGKLKFCITVDAEQNADEILVLNKGTVVECGTHNDLMAQRGIYANMWKDYQTSIAWNIGKEEYYAS